MQVLDPASSSSIWRSRRSRPRRHRRGHLRPAEGGVAVQASAVWRGPGSRLALDLDREAARRSQQEALIGVMFILAACAGILLLASTRHGGSI